MAKTLTWKWCNNCTDLMPTYQSKCRKCYPVQIAESEGKKKTTDKKPK